MKRVCVFCGSSSGTNPIYRETAEWMGTTLAERGLGLVFGGGGIGLMRVLASAALAGGAEVIGVIPRGLMTKEIAHDKVRDLRIVGSMHERKALMSDLADAFVALPGGYGTLEEFCEVLTWAQLGLHRKPCGLLNVNGFYEPFLRQLDRQVSEGFLSPLNRSLVVDHQEPSHLLDLLASYQSPVTEQWIDRTES
jgi:uncharacterized protein (TIGR00730 family)